MAHRSVCFVCLGNICRSPMAEGILAHLLAEHGLEDGWTVDSAGCGPWHVGEAPDDRAIEACAARGVALRGRGRQIDRADFTRFDHLLAMDADNLAHLRRIAPRKTIAALGLLRDYDPEGPGDVPDPFYGGASFGEIFELVARSCRGFLEGEG